MERGAQPGNSNARKENRLWAETIKRAVAQNDALKLRAAADKLVELAVAGDVSALRELGDRLDGKPKQQIEATGADDGPLRIIHESK